MSAIVGVYRPEGEPVERSDLERMLDCLRHRGPDGAGVWSDGPAGLGHAMLGTTPESLGETLPRSEAAGRLAVTADARLDNRAALIETLGLAGRRPEELTDGALILAAYERWEERCPEHLLGDFAFAVWDGRRQALFCARDHFGVKPFCYCASRRLFACASEIKALLALPEVPRRLNEAKIAEHLLALFDDPSITFYAGILRLPPGHALLAGREGVRTWRYWALDPEREVRLGSDAEYAEALREHFTVAVRDRLRSAVPVGAMLSGGLDSSSIVCTARHVLERETGLAAGGRLATFSAVFGDGGGDRPYIDAVLAQNSVEPHFVRGDGISPLADLDRVLWHQDEAVCAGNLYLNWAAYGVARERGVRVLLDGFDGDTTLSHGTGYLHELARKGRWLALTREATGYARHFHIPTRRLLWQFAWHYAVGPAVAHSALRPVRRAWRVVRPRPPAAETPVGNPRLNPEFVRRLGLDERLRDGGEGPRTEREHHYRRLTHAVVPLILEMLDRSAAAFGIELRFPFWDRRLAEFCLALPPEQKLRQGWNRFVMRQAMAGLLPAEVQWRGGKNDFHNSFDDGLRRFEQKRLDQALLEEPSVLAPYVDLSALRAMYRRYVDGAASAAEETAIWRAVSLALWLRQARLQP